MGRNLRLKEISASQKNVDYLRTEWRYESLRSVSDS
jgi:hypothetical protein